MRLQAQKAKERYFVAAAEWEASLMMIHKEFGAVWEPVAGNKLYEKEQQVCRKVDEVSFFIYLVHHLFIPLLDVPQARLDYESSVERLNASVQELTLQFLPQVSIAPFLYLLGFVFFCFSLPLLSIPSSSSLSTPSSSSLSSL